MAYSYLKQEAKAKLFEQHGGSANNTGSTEGQVALITFRIQHLQVHLQKNNNDQVTRRSLLRLVGHRRRLLDYLKRHDIGKYRALIQELGIRK